MPDTDKVSAEDERVDMESPEVSLASGDRRKVELVICTTPAELRMIAQMLEERSEVRVNWYHTRYSFRNEQTFKESK